jgi:hypothetical protein
MSKMQIVTLHHVIIIYNDIFYHLDGEAPCVIASPNELSAQMTKFVLETNK